MMFIIFCSLVALGVFIYCCKTASYGYESERGFIVETKDEHWARILRSMSAQYRGDS